MIFSNFLTESEWNAKHQPLPHLCLHGMLFSPQAWRPDECGARYLVCHAITQPGGGLCGSVWRLLFRSEGIEEELCYSNTRGSTVIPPQFCWAAKVVFLYGLRECLMPAFQYYLETSANDAIVSRSIRVFQAAQLFNQRDVKTSRPVAAADLDRRD